MTIVVDRHLRDVLHVDVVGVPGGVTSDVEVNERVTSWLRTITDDVEIVASVCTGVFVLAAAGVVHDEEVTTHWEDVDELSARFPRLQVRRDVRWVDQGRVVTSAGISAGIDMSLHLVERLASAELAQATAHRMDYDWRR
jgi:transcriptional regulator GlxA family with amidase domain